jgi:hypothetical protein
MNTCTITCALTVQLLLRSLVWIVGYLWRDKSMLLRKRLDRDWKAYPPRTRVTARAQRGRSLLLNVSDTSENAYRQGSTSLRSPVAEPLRIAALD